MYGGFYYDPTMILILPGLLLALWAQYHVDAVFRKYVKVPSQKGIPAARVAEALLADSGLADVPVLRAPGRLTDHYDPKENVLRLSDSVYASASLAALGVAAHEVGHAIQRREDYAPLRLRTAFAPMAQIGSFAAFPLFLLGLLMSFRPLMTVGILVFTAVVLFYLITLPVEFNASNRAIAALEAGGHLTYEEARPARKVLNAAGLTYVAAALQAILQLFRLLLLAGRRRD